MPNLISVIPVTLDLNPQIEVGILPFIEMPDIIIWQNRCFIPIAYDSANYKETNFAVARIGSGEANDILIRLQARTGHFIANTTIENVDPFPEVVRWGDRIFRLAEGKTYIEAFFTLAHQLVVQPQILPDGI